MRSYRLLLLLCPAAFRAQYADEMCSVFAMRLREASNPLARIWLWLETVVDVLVTAVQTHWDILLQDLVYAQRVMRRSPGFTVTAILVAALGVGATTAVYTITDYALLRPLPFPESDRLVKLWEDMSPGNYSQMEPSPANYRDWKRMSHSFSAMAALRGLAVNMTGVGDPQQVEGTAVTSDLLPMLGAQPMFGRLFREEDDRQGAPGTVLLSYAMWKGKFAGDPNVLGRQVRLDGEAYTVIGVMPGDFGYPRANVEIWTPMRFSESDFVDRNDNYLRVVAKLVPGHTVEEARSEMSLISNRLKQLYPRDNEHVAVRINPLRDEISASARLMLFALFGASFCVLLIACTNLANLLLARAIERRKELVLRKALGAGRERLVRQLLTESVLLACVGGIAGILLASAAVPLLSSLLPDALPLAGTPVIDWRIILFSLSLTLLTGICFGVLPSARGAKTPTTEGLQEGARQGIGGHKESLRSALVVAEIAISIVLLVSSGLLIRALWKIQQVNPGFRAENVITLRTSLPMPKYEVTSRRGQFYSQVLSGIRATPGVTSAGYVSFLPIAFGGGIFPVTIAGQPPNVDRAFHQASLRFVTPGYLDTMEIPLLRGRTISDADSATALHAAVVSESFAKEFWPHEDPLERQFSLAYAGTRTVVGVVGDVRVRGLARTSEPQVYLSYQQAPDGVLTWYAPKDLVVRSSVPSEQLIPALRRIITSADSEQPISDVQTLSQIVESDTAPRRTQVVVLSGFTIIALVLAAIGIHGLLSFTVANRRQEIGVRVAMGACSKDILGMILAQSVRLAFMGGIVGVLFSYEAAKSLNTLLAGIESGDKVTYLVAMCLVLTVTLAGSAWPALRALRVDPMIAMRSE